MKILVIFGGNSSENEISVITGELIASILKRGGDEVVPLYIAQSGHMYSDEKLLNIDFFKSGDLTKINRANVGLGGIYVGGKGKKFKEIVSVDVAINCCHGGFGENGGIAGLFECMGIPFVGAGRFESAAFMDKRLTKIVLSSLGVPVLDYKFFTDLEQAKECNPSFPVIVKPVSLGSSIGVEICKDNDEFMLAVESCLNFDDGVIVEPYITNRREINCAAAWTGEVLVSELEEVTGGGRIYSYHDKYESDRQNVCPAQLDGATRDYLKSITRTVFTRLNMRGVARFDYLLDGGRAYLCEINTVPGSLSWYLFAKKMPDFHKILSKMCEQAIAEFKKSQKKCLLNTGILQNLPSNACKTGHK